MAVIALDPFDGTPGPFSSRVASVGGTWIPIVNTPRIAPSGTRASGDNQYTGAGARLPLSVTNVTVTVPFLGANLDDETLWIYARYIDANNWYGARVTSFNREFRLFKNVAGSQTEIGTAYIRPTLPLNTMVSLALSVTGNALVLSVDGTPQNSTTDSGVTGAGGVGFFISGQNQQSASSWNGIQIDSFTADDGAGAGISPAVLMRRLTTLG